MYLSGFAGYKGSVIAGQEWGASMQEMTVPQAKTGSIEAMLHKEHGRNGYLLFHKEPDEKYAALIPHRAIGSGPQ